MAKIHVKPCNVNELLKRLALPHFYSHPILISHNSLRQFSERIVNEASLGLSIRSLCLWQASDDDEYDRASADEYLINIITRAPRISRVYGPMQPRLRSLRYFPGVSSMSWKAFRLLVNTAGPSLLEFENISIHNAEKKFSSSRIFDSLHALQSLFWHCVAKFDVNDVKSLRGCFPHLKSLTISWCHTSFLELLLHIE
jgi:hypothetical protein